MVALLDLKYSHLLTSMSELENDISFNYDYNVLLLLLILLIMIKITKFDTLNNTRE